MTQEYTPVEWVDETENQVGTVINKARLDQMQTAHHFADGFKEVDTVPTADPGVDYHMVVFCTADTTFYRWNGTQWVKDVDDSTLALLEAHEADHNNPHVVTKAQVGLGNVDNKGTVSSWQETPDNAHIPTEKLVKDSLDAKVDDSQIVTVFQGTPDNTHIASEKLTKDSLDGKVDKLVNKPTAGTYTKLTINAEGQVTAGFSLTADDIPSLDWSKISTGKPTTLAGYGITDAVTLNTAQTITGEKTFQSNILINSNGERGILVKRTGVSGWSRIRWDRNYTDNDALTGQLVNIIENDRSTFAIMANNRTNQDSGAVLSVIQSNSENYVTAPSRTYNSANVDDIVTIGSLASNPNVVHTIGNETIDGYKKFYYPQIKSVALSSGSDGYLQSTRIGTGSFLLIGQYNPAHSTDRVEIRMGLNDDGNVGLYLWKSVNGAETQTLIASL